MKLLPSIKYFNAPWVMLYISVSSFKNSAISFNKASRVLCSIKRIYLTDREKEAAKINERNRLARDLHDSVNQM
ncbi:histidine kinase, partial [Klebsiella pneumoniae]|uniref:histidine kinase n=1 Tax=Klebsiella pneumoniae TaxID=573 RepID=UPI0027304A39